MRVYLQITNFVVTVCCFDSNVPKKFPSYCPWHYILSNICLGTMWRVLEREACSVGMASLLTCTCVFKWPVDGREVSKLSKQLLCTVTEFGTTTKGRVQKLFDSWFHMPALYRVIRNDCRGFNNLSYTIHLR